MTRTLFSRQLPGGGLMVPTGRVRPITGHPLALLEGYIPGGARGFAPLIGIGPALKPISSASTMGGTPAGPGVPNNAASTGLAAPCYGSPLETSVNAARGVTIFWLGLVTSGGNGSSTELVFGVVINPTASPYAGLLLANYASSVAPNSGPTLYWNTAGGLYYTSTTAAANLGKVNLYSASYMPGSAATVYLNGSLVTTVTANVGAIAFYSGDTLVLSGEPRNANYSNTTGVFGGYIPGVLSADQHAELAAAPFSMLESAEPMGAFWWTGGSSGTTLLLAQAAWGWNKQGIIEQANIALAAKDWTWNPQAPGVAQTTNVPLAQKAWGWVGQPAPVRTTIALAQKALSWTPQAPVVRFTIALAQKAWAWVGQPFAIGQPTVVKLAQATWGWVAGKWQGASQTGGIVRGIIGGIVRGIVRR